MSERRGVALQSGVATGTSAKTLLQLLAAANHAIKIVEVGIGFHGTNNTHEPIKVELIRQTTAGTSSLLTIQKADDSVNDSFDTSAVHTCTAEPSGTIVLRAWAIHPQTGLVWQAHDEAPVIVGSSDRIGLRVTAGNDINADAYMCFEE